MKLGGRIMKKSLMFAVCAATMLMGASAFANSYSVIHPFYSPDKGQASLEMDYRYYHQKFKHSETTALAGKPRAHNSTNTINYGLTDKWVAYGLLYRTWNYSDMGHSQVDEWCLGAYYKFIDDGKTYFHLGGDYWQTDLNLNEKIEKGIYFEGKFGKNFSWGTPYAEFSYYNIVNKGGDDDGTFQFNVAWYKELGRKLGMEISVENYWRTDVTKDFFSGAFLKFKYAFTPKFGMTIYAATQLYDHQHAVFGLDTTTKEASNLGVTLSYAF